MRERLYTRRYWLLYRTHLLQWMPYAWDPGRIRVVKWGFSQAQAERRTMAAWTRRNEREQRQEDYREQNTRKTDV